ncbi:MAG: ABC transporter [Chromatiales bacterium]|nr:ABC transporter [Chromatiales bacterium]
MAFSYAAVSVFQQVSFCITPGLSLLRGGDGRGKTTLLRLMAGEIEPMGGYIQGRCGPVFFHNPLPGDLDDESGRHWLLGLRTGFVDWNVDLECCLIEEFGLNEHIDKPPHMLSKGSLRKLGLIGAFASGARLALLDTPYAALDGASRGLLSELLLDASEHPSRAWVIADFDVAPSLADVTFAEVVELGD